MDIIFRVATEDDCADWVALRGELWPECPAERHLLEIDQLLHSDGAVIVAVAEGAVIGFAEISIRQDHVEGASIAPVPYLEGWYVRDQYRGIGIGRGLMTAAEAWARQKGFTELASDAEADNTLSIDLHAKLGFREVGRNVCFIKQL